MIKLLASAYIWITGPYQVIQLAINIANNNTIPMDYLFMRILFSFLGFFYGIEKKDNRFSIFCGITGIEYIILIILNLKS